MSLTSETVDTQEERYCVCRGSYGNKFMIACDGCEEWFHGSCIGINSDQAKDVDCYYCPTCKAKDSSLKTLYKSKEKFKEKEKLKERDKIKERDRPKERDQSKEKERIMKEKEKRNKEKMKRKEERKRERKEDKRRSFIDSDSDDGGFKKAKTDRSKEDDMKEAKYQEMKEELSRIKKVKETREVKFKIPKGAGAGDGRKKSDESRPKSAPKPAPRPTEPGVTKMLMPQAGPGRMVIPVKVKPKVETKPEVPESSRVPKAESSKQKFPKEEKMKFPKDEKMKLAKDEKMKLKDPERQRLKDEKYKVRDEKEKVKIKSEKVDVREEKVKVKEEQIRLKEDTLLKQKEDKLIKLKEEKLKSKEDKSKPKEEIVKSKEDKLKPKEDILKPKEDKLKPKEDKPKPKEEMAKPNLPKFAEPILMLSKLPPPANPFMDAVKKKEKQSSEEKRPTESIRKKEKRIDEEKKPAGQPMKKKEKRTVDEKELAGESDVKYKLTKETVKGKKPSASDESDDDEDFDSFLNALSKQAKQKAPEIPPDISSSEDVDVDVDVGIEEVVTKPSKDQANRKGKQVKKKGRPRKQIGNNGDTSEGRLELQESSEEEVEKQCLGIACRNAARPRSRYCCDECGIQLAIARIRTFLPERLEHAKKGGAARARDEKLISELEQQQEVSHNKIEELQNARMVIMNLMVRAREQGPEMRDEPEDSEEEPTGDNDEVDCVICGMACTEKNAVRHMERCYNKFESKLGLGSTVKCHVTWESPVCDAYDRQEGTYCKKLKVLCPDHNKEKEEHDGICGCPLDLSSITETSVVCHKAKRACNKHTSWEKLRLAEIDMERVLIDIKLEDSFDEMRKVKYRMVNRMNLLQILLNGTITHGEGNGMQDPHGEGNGIQDPP